MQPSPAGGLSVAAADPFRPVFISLSLCFPICAQELGVHNIFPVAGWTSPQGHELEGAGPGVGPPTASLTRLFSEGLDQLPCTEGSDFLALTCSGTQRHPTTCWKSPNSFGYAIRDRDWALPLCTHGLLHFPVGLPGWMMDGAWISGEETEGSLQSHSVPGLCQLTTHS